MITVAQKKKRFKKIAKSRIVFNVFNYTALVVLSLFFVVPYVYVLSASFSDEITFIKNGFSLLPVQWSLGAYKFLLTTDSQMLLSIFNSLVLAIGGTVVTTLVSMLYAYPLSRKYLRGKKFFSVFMIFTMLFSGGLIPYFLVVSSMFDDSLLAIIVPGAMAPYYAILMRNFFLSVPDSLEEACKIDGGNNFLILFRIYFPLSMPVIATVALFAMVSNWNNYVGPLLFITTKSKYPLQYLIQQLLDDVNGIYPVGGNRIIPSQTLKYAAVVFGSLPMIILYPFLQKYYINGMMLGSVKE